MFLRDGMLDTIEPLRARFDGKLWINITNPFNDRYDDFIFPWNTSAAEEAGISRVGGGRRRLDSSTPGGSTTRASSSE
jgi:hypothetical protein